MAVVAVSPAMSWVYRKSDVELCIPPGPDPSGYVNDKNTYGLIDMPAGSPIPNPRTHKVNTQTGKPPLLAKSPEDVTAFDATLPREVSTAAIVEALTSQERAAWIALAGTNPQVADDLFRFAIRPAININSPLLTDPLARLIAAKVLTQQRVTEIVAAVLAA